MIEKIMIITNNEKVFEYYSNKFSVEFIEGDVLEVYCKVRDYVHKNHKLLTHPLMSSVKPNETPVRTVVMSYNFYKNLDIDSLNIIEDSISTYKKFLRDFKIPNWNENVIEDFKVIDMDLISHGLV